MSGDGSASEHPHELEERLRVTDARAPGRVMVVCAYAQNKEIGPLNSIKQSD